MASHSLHAGTDVIGTNDADVREAITYQYNVLLLLDTVVVRALHGTEETRVPSQRDT